jgi:hypothetical protein
MKIYTKLILATFLCLVIHQAMAQQRLLGLNIMPQVVSITSFGPVLGYSTGFNFMKKIDPKFLIELDLLMSYHAGGATCSYGIKDICYEPVVDQLYFLQIPLLMHYSISTSNISIIGGLQGSYLLRNISSMERKYTLLNTSPIIGLGSTKKLNENLFLLSQIRAEYILMDITAGGRRDNGFKFGLMLGLAFSNKTKNP